MNSRFPTGLKVLSAALVFAAAGCGRAEEPTVSAAAPVVREPAVAGRFYPAGREELARAVDGLLLRAEKIEAPGRPAALVAPHAGYVFSGETAARSFAQLRGSGVTTVLLVGSAHRVPFEGVALWEGDGWRTPLGVVPVDRELSGRIVACRQNFRFHNAAHGPEHSLEVELPFLQRILDDFKIVPILVGRADADTIGALGETLAEILVADEGAVVVCSADLTHFPPYDAAVEIDAEILSSIASLDVEKLLAAERKHLARGVPGLSTVVCARDAVIATMRAVKTRPARGRVLHYSNSGDVAAGDRARVVGYGAVAFWWTADDR